MIYDYRLDLPIDLRLESKSQLEWFKDFKIFSKEYCKSCAPIRDENKRVFVFVRVRRVQ